MAKMHTRMKRKLNLTSHHRGGRVRQKKKGTKTFKTQEAAKLWAEKHKIQNYELVNLKSSEAKEKKLKIVAKS